MPAGVHSKNNNQKYVDSCKMVTHTHTCHLCKLDFISKRLLREHNRSHHVELDVNGKILHRCVCGIIFTRRENLLRHWFEEHEQNQINEEVHACYLCLGPKNQIPRFATEEELDEHIYNRHFTEENKEDDFKYFGFRLEASAFGGVAQHFIKPLTHLPIEEHISIEQLRGDPNLISNIHDLVVKLMRERNDIKRPVYITLIIKATYVKYDNEGNVMDRVTGIPHPSNRIYAFLQMLHILVDKIHSAFDEIRERSEEFENIRGSNWSMECVDAIMLRFSSL